MECEAWRLGSTLSLSAPTPAALPRGQANVARLSREKPGLCSGARSSPATPGEDAIHAAFPEPPRRL